VPGSPCGPPHRGCRAADVAVGQREDGLALCEQVHIEPGLPKAPRLDPVSGLLDIICLRAQPEPFMLCAATQRGAPPRPDDDVGAMLRSSSACLPGRPRHEGEMPGVAGRDTRLRSSNTRRGGLTPGPGRGQKVSGRLALQVPLVARCRRRALEQVRDPGGVEHVDVLRWRNDGGAQAAARTPDVTDRAVVDLTRPYDLLETRCSSRCSARRSWAADLSSGLASAVDAPRLEKDCVPSRAAVT